MFITQHHIKKHLHDWVDSKETIDWIPFRLKNFVAKYTKLTENICVKEKSRSRI